jgi:hypothetical protein
MIYCGSPVGGIFISHSVFRYRPQVNQKSIHPLPVHRPLGRGLGCRRSKTAHTLRDHHKIRRNISSEVCGSSSGPFFGFLLFPGRRPEGQEGACPGAGACGAPPPKPSGPGELSPSIAKTVAFTSSGVGILVRKSFSA